MSHERDRSVVARNENRSGNWQAQEEQCRRDESVTVERAIHFLDERDARQADVGVVMLVLDASARVGVMRAAILEVNGSRRFASIEAHVQMRAAHRHCDNRKADDDHQHM